MLGLALCQLVVDSIEGEACAPIAEGVLQLAEVDQAREVYGAAF
jgi:hypothetical protein